jgi:formylglycine-generating enzyme required for sulfatase activity
VLVTGVGVTRPGGVLRVEALAMDFVWIPPGTFWMGAQRQADANRDPEARDNEAPVHQVTLTSGGWLGRVPVTVQQYRRFVEGAGVSEPRCFRRPDTAQPEMPVTTLSWEDARVFCAWASRTIGRRVRLPTEAEWEYACRAGTTTPYACPSAQLDSFAWTLRNSGSRMRVTGALRPNPWGLHDMHGNAYEWCADWHAPYNSEAVSNPAGPKSGDARVVRGGTFRLGREWARSPSRAAAAPDLRGEVVGFRVFLPDRP